ncbi:hypothetical protein [Sodaliphilus sp.]|uniref:hypothetical protein n=1 Tax=Sodaliphilus sp. TaxID=2815818 RepID=UPI00389055B9
MDQKFTGIIQQWLDTPDTERDYVLGALYLLKLTGNHVMHNNYIAKIDNDTTRRAIEYNLQKYYNFRIVQLTHEQVEEMARKAEKIADELHFDDEEEKSGEEDNADEDGKQKSWKPGKRDDHDELPEEIQALYVENLSLLRQMRELHLELRHLSGMGSNKSVCQDSDRYPFLKELIACDKKYHDNWKQYDQYVCHQK